MLAVLAPPAVAQTTLLSNTDQDENENQAGAAYGNGLLRHL